MSVDLAYHYPPELFASLVDAIPRLCKTKGDLLTFFRGAGVATADLARFDQLLKQNKAAFSKFAVTRELLTLVNERGDSALAIRREILKRVTQFDDFSVCWESDRAVARGLVAQVRDLVNVKDSFTRMNIERERANQERAERRQSEVEALRVRRAEREAIKQRLYALFPEQDAHSRGRRLEAILNALFESYDILIREAFTLRGDAGQGIIEQIDGLIDFDGHPCLVEMKWWSTPIGTNEIAPHLVRVYSRPSEVRGLFISYSPFTEAAINEAKNALQQGRTVILATLDEVVQVLESHREMQDWLRGKLRAALVDRNPYLRS